MNNQKKIILPIAYVLITFAVSLLVYFQKINLLGFETTIAIACGVIAEMTLFKFQQFEKIKNLQLKLILSAFIILMFPILSYIIHGFVYEVDSALIASIHILVLFSLSFVTVHITRKIIYFNNEND